jgi:hypothetical protein
VCPGALITWQDENTLDLETNNGVPDQFDTSSRVARSETGPPADCLLRTLTVRLKSL